MQNRTIPGVTGTPEDDTVAFKVNRVPAEIPLAGEGVIVNSVEVGKGVAATASAELENATASARPRKTGGGKSSLFKGTSEEASTI